MIRAYTAVVIIKPKHQIFEDYKMGCIQAEKRLNEAMISETRDASGDNWWSNESYAINLIYSRPEAEARFPSSSS